MGVNGIYGDVVCEELRGNCIKYFVSNRYFVGS